MISKEIQLSLSFCSALAAILLSSAPINEMTSLVGSGIAVLLSGGFFYGGISKYFADKKQGDQHMQDVIAASFKTLIDNKDQTGEQLKSVVEAVKILDGNMQDVIAASFKTLIDNQNQTGEQLKSVVEAIENLDYTLKFTLIGSISKYFADKEQRDQHTQDVIAASFKFLIDNQNQTGEQLKSVVEAIENLDDTLNGKLAEMSDTLSAMSDNVNRIKADAGNIENNTSKLTTLQKSAKSILDEISELSEGVGEISKVNEALRELMNAMDNQKEFYQTALNQYKGMTNKDYELIEMLARKLR